jgi:hypothetical protein
MADRSWTPPAPTAARCPRHRRAAGGRRPEPRALGPAVGRPTPPTVGDRPRAPRRRDGRPLDRARWAGSPDRIARRGHPAAPPPLLPPAGRARLRRRLPPHLPGTVRGPRPFRARPPSAGADFVDVCTGSAPRRRRWSSAPRPPMGGPARDDPPTPVGSPAGTARGPWTIGRWPALHATVRGPAPTAIRPRGRERSRVTPSVDAPVAVREAPRGLARAAAARVPGHSGGETGMAARPSGAFGPATRDRPGARRPDRPRLRPSGPGATARRRRSGSLPG